MKRFLLLLLFPSLLFSQQVSELNIPSAAFACKKWIAVWITHPAINTKDYNVLLFRKVFELSDKPDRFVIHISADNQYHLFVNGSFVTAGPARSDIRHWRYETIDIAPFLKTGKNSITAQVINWGTFKGWSQFTNHTAFLLQGFSDAEKIVNTDPSWKVTVNAAYRPNPVKGLLGYYGSYACDSIDGKKYPWGWQKPDYDDTKWVAARWFDNAYNHEEANGFWMLTPRNIQLQITNTELIPKLVRAEGIQLTTNPFNGNDSLIVKAGQKISILLDQQYITIGYPQMVISGGKEAKIKISYAEALYNRGNEKTNRNDPTNKRMIGFSDVVLPSGASHCTYSPLWLRPFRYVQLDIQTAGDPLVIHRFYNRCTVSPVECKASFSCSDPVYSDIWNICWRTDKVCAQDFLMSDASWEQLQYIGDSRIHALVMMALSGDDGLVRNAIRQFGYSRTSEGILSSNYPNDGFSIIPSYSLIWIDMIYDHMMMRGDSAFTTEFKTGIGNVLDWFADHLDKNNLLSGLPYWNFTDWAKDFENGVPKGTKDIGSALVTLQYVYSLQHAAEIYEFIGLHDKSIACSELAKKIKRSVYNTCWSPEVGLIAETPLKNDFSQHTNILAVLTNTVSQAEYRDVMEKVMNSSRLSRTTIYFDFYLFEALKKAEMPDYFIRKMEVWKAMVISGLSTTPETYEKPRSDCHPWTTHPAYEFLSLICGIQPLQPGFSKIMIRPQPGTLTHIQCAYPLPQGMLILDLEHKGNSISGIITVPENVSGTLVWMNEEMKIHAGKQKVSLK